MGCICAQLNYTNSGQTFRLNVTDVKWRRERYCARCRSAASQGESWWKAPMVSWRPLAAESLRDTELALLSPSLAPRAFLMSTRQIISSWSHKNKDDKLRRKQKQSFSSPHSCDPMLCVSPSLLQKAKTKPSCHHRLCNFRKVWWFYSIHHLKLEIKPGCEEEQILALAVGPPEWLPAAQGKRGDFRLKNTFGSKMIGQLREICVWETRICNCINQWNTVYSGAIYNELCAVKCVV